VGELYQAFANGEEVPGGLTDFNKAALRHMMLEASLQSSKTGKRQCYVSRYALD
jgi:predicted dehydrogenase